METPTRIMAVSVLLHVPIGMIVAGQRTSTSSSSHKGREVEVEGRGEGKETFPSLKNSAGDWSVQSFTPLPPPQQSKKASKQSTTPNFPDRLFAFFMFPIPEVHGKKARSGSGVGVESGVGRVEGSGWRTQVTSDK
jgi:hypothetical protein